MFTCVWTNAEAGFIRAFCAGWEERAASALSSRLRGVRHAAAQQDDVGAALDPPLRQLHAVDVPLGGTVVPGRRQRGAYGVDVARQALG